MRSVGLKELKNRLSEYVRIVAQGERVLVTNRDRVVAELVPPESGRALDVADAILADLLRLGYIDVLVTTGANLVHDLIEAFGGRHYQGTLGIEDGKLRENKVNRLYDVFLPEEGFLLLEERLRKLLGDLEAKEYTTREYLSEIGRRIPDPDSILRSATDAKVPVFCPALPDSILGLHSFFSSRERGFRLDPFGDLKEIIDLCFQAEKSGVVLLGGGVPKNFLFQAMLASPNTFDYAVQITTDRPEAGGLSGASLDEAISWGKVGTASKRVTVYADATIAFPLVVGALRERIGR